MRVISFSFNKISAEKKKEINKDISISTNMQVLDIKKDSLVILENQDLLAIDFEFTIKYQPEYASLVFEGKTILSMDKSEKDQFKTILEEWKDKKVSEDLQILLLQLVFSKCSLKALELEESLNLPKHIPIVPKITKPDKKEDRT